MADNVPITAGTGTNVATDDIGGVHFQRVKIAAGADGTAVDVSAAAPLPTQLSGITFTASTLNSSSVQLTAGATFTGTIESAFNQPAAQVMVFSDQPFTAHVDQFNDLSNLISTDTFVRTVGQPMNENVQVNGDFIRVRVVNNGAATTTTLRIETTYGPIPPLPRALTSAGNLKVVNNENGIASTANSTSTNLGIGAVFTGTSEDVSEYSMIMVTVFVDQASATDGLSVEQSSNGTNWDIADKFTVPITTAGNGKTFSFGVSAKFYRLVYTNGGVATTNLRIQSLFSKTIKKSSSVRPQDARGNENDLEEHLAFLMGFNGTSFDRLRSTIANGLAVDVTRQPTLTKGTQGATGVSTQDLKDAGRVIFSASTVIAGVTAVTTEALLTMVPTRDGVATATVTTQTVTSGKRLRITGISAGFVSTAAAVLSMRFALRMNPSGAVSATSPILRILSVPSGAALVQAGGWADMEFPDGIEFSGTHQFGITQIGSAATGTCWVSVTGFEY